MAAAEHLAYANDDGRLDWNEDAVSVSISRVNEPMFAAKRRKSGHADWIVLVLSATILWMHDCRFCWRNAVRNEIKHHPRYSSDSKLRSEEHTSELQSLMRISYAVFCLKKKMIQSQRTQNPY